MAVSVNHDTQHDKGSNSHLVNDLYEIEERMNGLCEDLGNSTKEMKRR